MRHRSPVARGRTAALGRLLERLEHRGQAIAAPAGRRGSPLHFARELGDRLEPGKAALLVLVRESTPDKVLPEIKQYGGHVLQTSLSDEAEERLRDALGDAPPAA